MKKIFLDTETTGLNPQNDRIVEIAAITYEGARRLPSSTGGEYHQFINPETPMPDSAFKIHGLNDEFLADKPFFAAIAESFIDYVRGGEIIIHNAEFDHGFLNAELKRLNKPPLENIVGKITCTLKWSRENNPALGMHNLNALCRFFDIDLAEREQYHNALVDARLLGDVYFRMTQRQTEISMAPPALGIVKNGKPIAIRRVEPTAEELSAHNTMLADMQEETKVIPLYNRPNGGGEH